MHHQAQGGRSRLDFRDGLVGPGGREPGIFGATQRAVVVGGRYRPDTDPAVARAFWDAGWLAYNTAGLGFSAWIAIVVAATLTYRVLPLWTAWIGVGT